MASDGDQPRPGTAPGSCRAPCGSPCPALWIRRWSFSSPSAAACRSSAPCRGCATRRAARPDGDDHAPDREPSGLDEVRGRAQTPWYAARWPCRAAAQLHVPLRGLPGPPVLGDERAALRARRRSGRRTPGRRRSSRRTSVCASTARSGTTSAVRAVVGRFGCHDGLLLRERPGPGAGLSAMRPGPGAYWVRVSARRYACTWLALSWPTWSPERMARMPGTRPASRSAANSSAAAVRVPVQRGQVRRRPGYSVRRRVRVRAAGASAPRRTRASPPAGTTRAPRPATAPGSRAAAASRW